MSKESSTPVADFGKLEIPDAAHFVALFDKDIREGVVTLYPWQVEELLRLSGKYNKLAPLRESICAVNGSGKDKIIIAPLAMYYLCCREKANIVITSASAGQIRNQTEPYIRALADSVNSYLSTLAGHPVEFVTVRWREISCSATGSIIRLFATDEEGKAEGFHQIGFDTDFVIIVNEAKSVDEGIFRALRRCNDYTVRLNISSPGKASGHFYERHKSGDWITRDIKASDCPHLGPKFADDIIAEYGPTHPLVRSMVYAEFGSEDGGVIIDSGRLDKILKKQVPPSGNEIVLGLDASWGGEDETVITARQGNKFIGIHSFRYESSEITMYKIEEIFNKYPGYSRIIADVGGGGKIMVDELRRRGWERIVGKLNNAEPRNPKAYKNWGVESWFNLKLLVEESVISWPKELQDALLLSQLRDRCYESDDSGILKLESKKKLDKSPDRADSFVLCYSDFDYRVYSTTFRKEPTFRREIETPRPKVHQLSRLVKQLIQRTPMELQVRSSSLGRIYEDQISDLNKELQGKN